MVQTTRERQGQTKNVWKNCKVYLNLNKHQHRTNTKRKHKLRATERRINACFVYIELVLFTPAYSHPAYNVHLVVEFLELFLKKKTLANKQKKTYESKANQRTTENKTRDTKKKERKSIWLAEVEHTQKLYKDLKYSFKTY